MPWFVTSVDADVVDALSAQTGLSAVTARVLASRGISTKEEARRFLSPDLARDWADPEVIPGMTEVADRVAAAVRAGEHIVVFGDFDLDGVSASAVAARGLRAMGAAVSAIVPHRFREGYGLSEGAIERLVSLRPSLVVTVDCGISSAAEVAVLARHGIDVVITDHHEPGTGIPLDVPVADPRIDAAGCPSRDLAGAGVALKLVQAVGARLGFPDVWRELADLATLGTVADVVPLLAENRALVADGVERMRRDPRVAIAALAAVSGVSLEAFSAEAVGFSLAPRLNAAGRMADPQLALDLLMTDDPGRAEDLSRELDELNRLRQNTEADLAAAATALAERTYRGERALVLAGEGWHEGVKGIVASRLTALYHVPTLLLTVADGEARGSGRTIGHVDLFAALTSCADILTRFGGHAAAVGCTLSAEDVDELRRRLVAHFDTLPASQFETSMHADAEMELGDVSVELAAEFDLLAPFGHANPVPLMVSRGVFMNGRQRVGKLGNHLRFTAFDGAVSVPAISFRCAEIDDLVDQDGAVDLAYEITADQWRGRNRVQLRVRDFVVHDVPADAPARELVESLFAQADAILAREEYANIEDADAFHTKLAGVTFEGRQDVLGRVVPGIPLRLVRQPENQFDSNACALFDPHGDQVGFLNRRLAAALAATIDKGVGYDVEVTEVTGGEEGRSLGVNVLVSRRGAGGGADGEDAVAQRASRRVELAALPADALDRELTERFIGNRSLHEAQVRALAHLAAGENTLAVMATGRGKSLIFHLHAARTALRDGRASIFIFPLRALVADQAYHLEEVFAEVGLVVRTVTGESSQGERDEAFSALAEGSLNVVLTTPEFLDLYAGRFAQGGRVGFVVVDEAHHVGMSRAGNRPAYARLGLALETLGSPVVLAVTATADDATATAIRSTLHITATVLDPTVRDNLVIEDRRGIADKDGYLLVLAARPEKSVIYVNSRDQSVKLARMLRKRVPSVAMRTAFYNGGLARSVRHAVEHAFRAGEVSLVIATSAFGEGVNIPDIRNVVLYHLPFNSVEFNQMSGRAGRDGAVARVHLLFGQKDARINETILSSLAPARDDMVALYVVLRDLGAAEGAGFEITNAELAERCRKTRKGFALDEGGISSALGIFRELGFVTGEGHGAYRRLTFVPGTAKVDLESSVRYAEGKDEVEEFGNFKAWVLGAQADELLARFNRPILPRE
ncbi:MAG: single-stranded-DNA-specific exonuclease RecJ [Coriobacteriia bacterium]|nr:single-stranded-DNA-specific exonuclease RecJ [Coriobacteriia bacterium]